jgi:magnesium transporter
LHPRHEAPSEIESSSRLAIDRDISTLSTPVVARGDGPDAFLSPVGFILTKRFIVSIRFAELAAFTSVADLIRGDEHLRTS